MNTMWNETKSKTVAVVAKRIYIILPKWIIHGKEESLSWHLNQQKEKRVWSSCTACARLRRRRYTAFATTTIILKYNPSNAHAHCYYICIRADGWKPSPSVQYLCLYGICHFAVPVFHFNDRSCRGFTINSGFVCCSALSTLVASQHCICVCGVDLCFTCDLRATATAVVTVVAVIMRALLNALWVNCSALTCLHWIGNTHCRV